MTRSHQMKQLFLEKIYWTSGVSDPHHSWVSECWSSFPPSDFNLMMVSIEVTERVRVSGSRVSQRWIKTEPCCACVNTVSYRQLQLSVNKNDKKQFSLVHFSELTVCMNIWLFISCSCLSWWAETETLGSESFWLINKNSKNPLDSHHSG